MKFSDPDYVDKLHAAINRSLSPLFDPEQATQLDRVGGAIGRAILAFCRSRLTTGHPEFHADELREWVAARHPGAPGSADRILRALRRTGQITYVVVNRRASLYRLF